MDLIQYQRMIQKNKPLKIQGLGSAPEGTRTPDPRITNALLYQLSHGSILRGCPLTPTNYIINTISFFGKPIFLNVHQFMNHF